MKQYKVTFTKEGRKGSLIIFAVNLSEATSVVLHMVGIPSGFSIKQDKVRAFDTGTEYGFIAGKTITEKPKAIIL